MANIVKKYTDDFNLESSDSVDLPFQLIPNISVYTLKAYVLEKVDTGHYKDATDTLKQHLDIKFPYQTYKDKVQSSILLAIELINSIENNNNFPGLSLMPKSKRQEIRDKNIKMREDLKKILEAVVKTYRQYKHQDDRSTVYVVRALWFSLLFVVVLGFSIDMHKDRLDIHALHAADAAASWITEKFIKLF